MSGADAAYNPLDKVNLGRSVAEAMLQRPAHSLANLKKFNGAGIYAIYYVGEFTAYETIAERNRDNKFRAPIYVGKAVSPGARKGQFGLAVADGPYLWSRLREHADSISATENLRRADFFCRYLVVDDIWIPLGESLLIARFSPIWNKLVDGFGNHDPGKGRHQGMRPRWDVLHPGRGWAEQCQERPETAEQIGKEVAVYLLAAPNGTEEIVPDEV